MQTRGRLAAAGALVASALLGAIPTAAAQVCVPSPFRGTFQNEAIAELQSGSSCSLTATLDIGSGATTAAIVYYRRAHPSTSVRYGFRVDMSALGPMTLANRSVQLFAASAPVVVDTGPLTSQLAQLQLVGASPDPELWLLYAQGGASPQLVHVPMSGTVFSFRIEIHVGSGTEGYVRYWINKGFSDPPDGVLDNGGAGLENAAWQGVISAEIGLSSPSNAFRADEGGNPVVFDQFESDDDLVFWNNFDDVLP